MPQPNPALGILCALMIAGSACSHAPMANDAPFSPPPPVIPPVVAPVQWLADHAIKVRSLAANDADFSDLAPLLNVIGNARVVMLGEQSHQDGTTFEAKVRLIRFLHEQMGFDVLAFEAGAYDCREAWKSILAGEPPVAAARQSIFEIWSYSAEVQPLFEYIALQSRGATPLELTGIDPQFTGPVGRGTGARFAGDLERYLVARGSTLPNATAWPAFRAVADRIALQYYRDNPSTAEERDAFSAGSRVLRAELVRLREASSAFETSYWAQLGDALDAQGRGLWTEDPLDRAFIRDSSMARNLLWMANDGYPGRKIIVWAASQHIASTLVPVRQPGSSTTFYPNYATMGQLVKAALGARAYSIAFLAGNGAIGAAGVHSGEIPPVKTIPAVITGSWDAMFLQAGLKNAFLNLNLQQEGGAWMASQRIARPLGYAAFEATWPDVFDGFFFTAEMLPATRAP